MMSKTVSRNTEAFLALVRAGLWERDEVLQGPGAADSQREVLQSPGAADFPEVLRLAEEQTVVGLVAAGLEQVADGNFPQGEVLQLAGRMLPLEQRNRAMNAFVARLFEELREAGIAAFLVKGQGIAQCYARPLWRACGDVDLLLDGEDYERAKALLLPRASRVEAENPRRKHLGMVLDGWMVELHGTLRSRLSARANKVVDAAQAAVCRGGKVRPWMNGGTQVLLPAPDEDVVFVFSHILQHFFGGGIGLRQICDWCRLLYTYADTLDAGLLEARLRQAGLMSEWKAFAALAVDRLGVPSEAMPLYAPDRKWSKMGERICRFVLKSGNFGRNRDQSYIRKSPYLVRKFISFVRRVGDLLSHARIFPLDSMRFFPGILVSGVMGVLRGE